MRVRHSAFTLLTVLILVSCDPQPEKPLTSSEGSIPEEYTFGLRILSERGDFHAEGWVRQGSLFTVAGADGVGLGFRPLAVEEYGSGSEVVTVEVVRLAKVDSGHPTEAPLVRLKILEGGSGSVDPGDDEGTFTVFVLAADKVGP